MTPEDADTITAAWRTLTGNRYARTILALVDGVEESTHRPAIITAIVRDLPAQLDELTAVITKTGQALADLQAKYDQAFDAVRATLADQSPSVLDFLRAEDPDPEAPDAR